MRVLLADSDTVFLESLQSFLWDRRHEVEIACDGLECMALLREFVPDVLVLDGDLLWGGSDGVLAEMREDPLLARIPVIVSASGNPIDELMALSRFPVACLSKPYRLGELLTHVESVGRFESRWSPDHYREFNIPLPASRAGGSV